MISIAHEALLFPIILHFVLLFAASCRILVFSSLDLGDRRIRSHHLGFFCVRQSHYAHWCHGKIEDLYRRVRGVPLAPQLAFKSVGEGASQLGQQYQYHSAIPKKTTANRPSFDRRRNVQPFERNFRPRRRRYSVSPSCRLHRSVRRSATSNDAQGIFDIQFRKLDASFGYLVAALH